MFLGGLLEVVKLELYPLAGNQQIRFDLCQSTLQLRVKLPDDNGFAVCPVMNILGQRPFNAHGFTQPLAVNVALINALAPLPQYPAKLTEALKQHAQIAVLYISAGSQPHVLQLCRRDFPHAGDLAERQRFDKRWHLIRGDDVLAVGLIEIRGDFGEKFYRRNARRGGEL